MSLLRVKLSTHSRGQIQSMVGSVLVSPGSWNSSLSLRTAGKQRQLINVGIGMFQARAK